MDTRDWFDRELFIRGMKAYIGFSALITFMALLMVGIQNSIRLNDWGYLGGNFVTYGAFLFSFLGVPILLGTLTGIFWDASVSNWNFHFFQMNGILRNGLITYSNFVFNQIFLGIAMISGFIFTMLAAVYVGYKAEDAKLAFGTWFWICALGTGTALLARMLTMNMYLYDFPLAGLAIITNGLFYGGIAALVGRSQGR